VEPKKHNLPKEISDLFIEFHACQKCRDSAIRQIFSSRKAISYAKKAIKAQTKAWKLVFELYPKLKNKAIRWDMIEPEVISEFESEEARTEYENNKFKLKETE